MDKQGVHILFLSAGRRVELLHAFRRAYRSLQLEGNIIALDVDTLAPALRVADRPYVVARLEDAGFVPGLLEICRREKPNMVFPLIDPDIPVLARHRKEIEKQGARVSVVSEEAARTTSDKWKTYRFFRELGIPTPESWRPGEIDPARISFPLMIKPRFGSAAKGAFKIRNSDELAFFQDYVSDPIIQEFLPGPEITSDVICDLSGKLLGVVSRRRIEVRFGEVSKGVTVLEPSIIEACTRIAGALPAIGPITVQCMRKKDRFYFTEVNPRLGGGVPLGIAAGVDSPKWLLAREAGLPVEIPAVGHYRSGLYLTRYDESFFLDEKDREQMEGHRL